MVRMIQGGKECRAQRRRYQRRQLRLYPPRDILHRLISHRNHILQSRTLTGSCIRHTRLRPRQVRGKPFPFLALPRELRDLIYGYSLGIFEGKTFDSIQAHARYHAAADNTSTTWKPKGSLLVTNRQIYTEATEVLYERGIFLVHVDNQFPRFGRRSEKTGWFVGAAIPIHWDIARITNLVLRIDVSDFHDWYLRDLQWPSLKMMVSLKRLRIVATSRRNKEHRGPRVECAVLSVGSWTTRRLETMMAKLVSFLPCSIKELVFGVEDLAEWVEKEVFDAYNQYDGEGIRDVVLGLKGFRKWEKKVFEGKGEVKVTAVQH